MPTTNDFADDRPPAYGQPTQRLDPLAEPPRYSLLERFSGAITAPPATHFAQPRLQDRDLEQSGHVIRHWQDEQRRGATAEERCKSLLYRSSRKKKKGTPWYKITWKRGGIAAIVLLIAFIAIGVGVRLSRRDHDSDEFTYDDAYIGTPLAVTTGFFRPDEQISLYFYQTNDTRLCMTTETGPNLDHQVFNVSGSALANGTGIAHVIRDQNATYMRTSLYIVNTDFMLQELRSMNGPGGGDSVTSNTWTGGSLGDTETREISHTNMNIAASYDPLTQVYENGTKQCNEEGGIVSLFYRPAGNDSLIQEIVRNNPETGDEVWIDGAKFEGASNGSQIVSFFTPGADKGPTTAHTRWLYALDEEGRLLEWSCENCCKNTTGLWRKTPQPYALVRADPDSNILDGHVEDNEIVIFYRQVDDTIAKVSSSFPPASNSSQTNDAESTPSSNLQPNADFRASPMKLPWFPPTASSRLAISQTFPNGRQIFQGYYSQLWYAGADGLNRIPTGPPQF